MIYISCVANPDQKFKHSSQKIKHSSEKTSHRIRCRDVPHLCYYNLCRKMRACFSKIENLYFKLPDAAKSTFRPPQSSQVLLNHPGNQILVLTPSVSDERMMKQNQIFDDPYHQKIKLHVQFGYVYKIVFLLHFGTSCHVSPKTVKREQIKPDWNPERAVYLRGCCNMQERAGTRPNSSNCSNLSV